MSLPQPKREGRRIAVLTALVEMGKFTDECHAQVAELSLKHLDILFCLGDECTSIVDRWQREEKPVFWCKDREEVVRLLRKQLKPGDVVLLKGANKKQLWKVLEEI